MTDPRKQVFDAIKAARGKPYVPDEVVRVDAFLDTLSVPRAVVAAPVPVSLPAASSGHELGASSLQEMRGIHPALDRFVRRLIQLTPVDFGVHDGLRTIAEQKAYVAKGVSQTMNSMHLPQADGYGHAVDLVPYINGKLRWEWPPIYQIAAAAAQVCREQNVHLFWGACWRDLMTIEPNAKAMEKAVADYVAARKKAGKKAFTDGPHYELRL